MTQDDAFAADLLRGHTDTIVLGVLRRGDAYGFEIYKAIRDATGGGHEIKEATLYATNRRLEKDGPGECYWGDEAQGGQGDPRLRHVPTPGLPHRPSSRGLGACYAFESGASSIADVPLARIRSITSRFATASAGG